VSECVCVCVCVCGGGVNARVRVGLLRMLETEEGRVVECGGVSWGAPSALACDACVCACSLSSLSASRKRLTKVTCKCRVGAEGR
jgi:hypothetical protein